MKVEVELQGWKLYAAGAAATVGVIAAGTAAYKSITRPSAEDIAAQTAALVKRDLSEMLNGEPEPKAAEATTSAA